MTFHTSGQGFPLIFIHGFPFNHELWQPAITGLDQQYRVITIDLPGISGKAVAHELTMESMAEELRKYLDENNIRQCILFGHSMGGYLGAECLKRFPERLAGLSFIHSLASADDEEKKALRDKILALISKGEDEKMSFLKAMVPQLFSGHTRHACRPVIEKILKDCERIPAANIGKLYRSIRNRRDHLPAICNTSVPVQWVIGDDDTATPKSQALEQCHLPAISLVHTIEDCGHMSMIEKPKVLNRYISNFCRFVIK